MIKFANIKKGIVSTATGVVIIIGALMLQFSPEVDVSWTETLPAVAFGLVLLGVDDPRSVKEP